MPRLPVGHRSKAIQTSGRYLTPVQNAVYALPSRSESGGLACLKSLSGSCRSQLAGTGMVEVFIDVSV